MDIDSTNPDPVKKVMDSLDWAMRFQLDTESTVELVLLEPLEPSSPRRVLQPQPISILCAYKPLR